MLLENQELDMASQKVSFINILDEWINYPPLSNHSDNWQIDDIILLEIRI